MVVTSLSFGLCVCKYGASADNLADAVDQFFIYGWGQWKLGGGVINFGASAMDSPDVHHTDW